MKSLILIEIHLPTEGSKKTLGNLDLRVCYIVLYTFPEGIYVTFAKKRNLVTDRL